MQITFWKTDAISLGKYAWWDYWVTWLNYIPPIVLLSSNTNFQTTVDTASIFSILCFPFQFFCPFNDHYYWTKIGNEFIICFYCFVAIIGDKTLGSSRLQSWFPLLILSHFHKHTQAPLVCPTILWHLSPSTMTRTEYSKTSNCNWKQIKTICVSLSFIGSLEAWIDSIVTLESIYICLDLYSPFKLI